MEKLSVDYENSRKENSELKRNISEIQDKFRTVLDRNRTITSELQ